MANLKLFDLEEDAFQEDGNVLERDLALSMVGTILTDNVVNFPSLRNTMADLWHPISAIAISNIVEKRYLFNFFHPMDLNKVLEGRPWFFSNHPLLLHK